MWYSLSKLQTSSLSVGNAMKLQDRDDTKSIIKFIKTFNKTFDCLNVMTTNSRGNINKLPDKWKENPRFEVIYLYGSLLSEFSLFHHRLVPSSKIDSPFCISPPKILKSDLPIPTHRESTMKGIIFKTYSTGHTKCI